MQAGGDAGRLELGHPLPHRAEQGVAAAAVGRAHPAQVALPLFVGSGGPDALIYRDGPLATFELTETTPLKSGIVILSYRAR